MPTYSTTDIIKILQSQEISLFTLSDFAKLFALDNQQTLYKKIARLEQKQIIKKLIKGKYQFLLTKPNEFQIANFLYSPSYVSLESALSFYSIITGFSYELTSLTPKPTKTVDLNDRLYKYTHVAPNLFWGYEKKENFLLADPEKALLDYIYLATKGLRNPVFDEMDFSSLNHAKLELYLQKFHNQSINKMLQKLRL
jgi:predicted transcriptional regulator of viral defense system